MNEQDRQSLRTAQANVEHNRQREKIGRPVAERVPPHALARIRSEVQKAYVNTLQEGKKMPPAPLPTCRTCGNSRFVRRNLAPGHPDFGKCMPCPTCHSDWMEHGRAQEMSPRWALSATERALACKPFGRREQYPIVEEAARRLKVFLDNAIAGTPTHYYFALHGTPGTGKTHLCLRAALRADEASVSVIYTTGTSLAEKFKDFGYKDCDHSKREANARRTLAMNDLFTARLLVLDEVDHISGDWTKDQLLEVLNKRRHHNRATLLAGNNLHLLGRTTDHATSPVVSRLKVREGVWIDFSDVPDARALVFTSAQENAS